MNSTLLDHCRTSTQLTPAQIDAIVRLLTVRCAAGTKVKIQEKLSDVRGISKTGHLSRIVLNGDNVTINTDGYSTWQVISDLRQLLLLG